MCENKNCLLPSIESFQKRHQNPKVYYIFYEYFYKAVMGEARWKESVHKENARFGTNIAEAFTHALLENNYFAWLFDYKSRAPPTKPSCLKTEYDTVPTADNDSHYYSYLCDEVVQGFEIVADQELSSGDFLLLPSTDENYAAEEERRQSMQEMIIETAKQDEDRMKQYNEHQTQLDLFNLPDEYTKEEHSKKRRKCMRGLKVYTAAAKNSNTISPPSSRSTTKEARNNKDKGWSDKANKFLTEMKARIKADEEAGTQKKWEKMYREIAKAVKKARDSSEESGGEDTAFQVDCNEMYEL